MVRRVVQLVDNGAGLSEFALRLLLDRERAGAVQIERVTRSHVEDAADNSDPAARFGVWP